MVQVYHAPGMRAVGRILDRLAREGTCHVSDLSLGGWRPFQLAAEWDGLPDMDVGKVDGGPTEPPSIDFSRIAAAGIEAEALGTRVVRDAHARASALLAGRHDGRRRNFIVVVPHAPNGWREEDRLVLRCLADALDPEAGQIFLLATAPALDANILPDDLAWTWCATEVAETAADLRGEAALAALPGLLPAEFGVPGLPLDDGRLLVAPELRAQRPAPVDFDRVKPLLGGAAALSAYAEMHGSNFHVDPQSMAAHAARAFGADATELSIDYLKRGIECARGPWRRGLLCQLQGYRIASHRFREAAAQDVSCGATGQVGAFLEMSRGWGYALCGDGAAALPYLSRAADLLSGSADTSFLRYLRNITALALARSGRTGEALALEYLIAEENVPPGRSWPMHFVNQINIARLLMARDPAAAASHYAEAFATQEGGRSPVDRIYANMVRARLAERLGNDARPNWLRAALHFAAWDIPEALGSRHAAALVPEAAALSPHARTESVAAALGERLGYAAAGGEEEPADTIGIATGASFQEGARPVAILAGDGWSAVAIDGPVRSASGGPARRQLNRCLAEEVLRCARPPTGLRIRTVAIDDRLGCEMALDRNEYIEVALRLGVSRLFDRGCAFVIEDGARRQALLRCSVALNPQVVQVQRHCDRVALRFKRYREDATVDDPLGVIERAQHRTSFAALLDLADEAALLSEICRLAREGAVRLVASHDAGAVWSATA